ncbi:MAG: SRPBCC family protein [Gaiellaceae bacterium]
MPSFEVAIEIARPPEEVFAYLTDVPRIPEWQSSAGSAEVDGEVREGARIRERRTFMGHGVKVELEVTRYEPPRRFDVSSRGGPVSYEVRHALERSGGGTHLDVEVGIKLSGMMRLAAQGPLKLAEREFRADFTRFKDLLERDG